MENKIKKGFYTTEYFKKTKKILINNEMHNETTMQFYCLKCNDYMLSGIEEIKKVLLNNFKKEELEKLEFYFRNDGEIINRNEPVISITGDYSLLCQYENIFNSILCRNSSVATNSYELSKVVNLEKIINMNERSDHYSLQEIDDYSS
jgi:nicotinate phosphoribosyltransferase